LEYQMCRFAKMILRDRCSTSYDLASIFRGRRSTLDRWTGKISKRIGTSLSALHSTFHFWRPSRRILRFWCLALRKMRKSRRIASFRMLSSSKNEDVYTTLNYTTPHYITLHDTTYHYTPLHYITLNDTAPQIDRSTDRQTDRQTDR